MAGQKARERRGVFVLLSVFACSIATGGTALAQMPAPAPAVQPAAHDTAPVEVTVDFAITVHADRSAEELTTRRLKVLSEAAIRSAGQFSQSFVDGMETMRVVEAYTLKTDGRKIPVEPSNIITRDAASGSLLHMRDLKIRTVIFSDVAVGDTVVAVTRRNKTTGVFPGQYIKHIMFSRMIPFAPSTVRIAAPTALKLKVAALGAGLHDDVTVNGATTMHSIRYEPLPRQYGEAGATSALDRDPRVLISTFASYEEQAKAYWAQTRARTIVTPDIQTLADTITASITDRRAQAVAIDQWVKRNIRYIAIYLGSGRVIPYPAATVLKHKFGDCKDHVTLMTALLAAKGIASEHVLINSGNAYTLPEPPTMAYINHVILYLPEFGVYDDPTSSYAAFGVLGIGTYDKPVIRVSDAGAHRAHTPAMKAADHVSINRTRVFIAADGTITGETEQISTGIFAINARRMAVSVQSIGLQRAAESRLRALHTPGTGRFEIAPLSSLDTTYVIRGAFKFGARMRIGARAVWPIPLGLPIHVRPGQWLLGKRKAGRQLPFVCLAGRQVEEIELTFADGMPRPRRLRGRTLDTRLFTYESHYVYSGNTMIVRREFESHVPRQVCAPEVEAEIASGLKLVQGSINSRLQFPRGFMRPSVEVGEALHASRYFPRDW